PRCLSSCSLCVSTHTPPSEIYTLSLHDALPIWVISPAMVNLLRFSFTRTRETDVQARPDQASALNFFPERHQNGGVNITGLSSIDRKSTRLNSSHEWISYAVFCLKKKKKHTNRQ